MNQYLESPPKIWNRGLTSVPQNCGRAKNFKICKNYNDFFIDVLKSPPNIKLPVVNCKVWKANVVSISMNGLSTVWCMWEHLDWLFGLSIKRPILDHHPKAHIHEIRRISPVKSGRFHPEIWWISPRYHLWNPPKIIKASVSAKTLQFDECRVGDFTLKSGRFHPDFTCEIHPKL